MKEEGLSEDQKQEKRQQHAQKETEFLRLKRSRLGVEDFEALKVIGRGAFGEVRSERGCASEIGKSLGVIVVLMLPLLGEKVIFGWNFEEWFRCKISFCAIVICLILN